MIFGVSPLGISAYGAPENSVFGIPEGGYDGTISVRVPLGIDISSIFPFNGTVIAKIPIGVIINANQPIFGSVDSTIQLGATITAVGHTDAIVSVDFNIVAALYGTSTIGVFDTIVPFQASIIASSPVSSYIDTNMPIYAQIDAIAEPSGTFAANLYVGAAMVSVIGVDGDMGAPLPLKATIYGTKGVYGLTSASILIGSEVSAKHGISGYCNATIPIDPNVYAVFVSPANGVIGGGIPIRTQIFASAPRLEQYDVVHVVDKPHRSNVVKRPEYS